MSDSRISTDSALRVGLEHDEIIVQMKNGKEIRFRPSLNPRLARGTRAQLARIEISPDGLHWPDLDEDVSFQGLMEGDFGQSR